MRDTLSIAMRPPLTSPSPSSYAIPLHRTHRARVYSRVSVALRDTPERFISPRNRGTFTFSTAVVRCLTPASAADAPIRCARSALPKRPDSSKRRYGAARESQWSG